MASTSDHECFKKKLFAAIRCKNIDDNFKEIVDEHYVKCEPFQFDQLLSEFYEEINLKGIRLPEKLAIFAENRLIRTRLFETAQKPKNDFSRVLQRVDLLSLLINDLNAQKESLDSVFFYIIKIIALNIHILKKQLNFSYNLLPWEEIEFCSVIYMANWLGQDITLVSNMILNRDRILQHLNNFHSALCNEKPKFSQSKMKFTNRSVIKSNILTNYPQFVDLYADYETLRDIYSLRRMQQYLQPVLSCHEEQMKQFAVERTLQVIGENLKNTPESPNISSDTEERLLNSAPKNLKKVLTSLRNMLSHSAILEKKILLGEKNNDGDVVNDLKKVYTEVTVILYEKLKYVCEEKKLKVNLADADANLFLTRESDKVSHIISKLKLRHPEDAATYTNFQNLVNQKLASIQKLHGELNHEATDWDFTKLRTVPPDDEPLQNFIRCCTAVDKLKDNPREQILMMVDAVEAHLFEAGNIRSISDYKELLESDDYKNNAEEKVENICRKIEEALKSDKEKQRFYQELEKLKAVHFAREKILKSSEIRADDFLEMIKVFPSKVAKSLEGKSPQADLKEIKAAVKVVSDAYGILVQSVASDSVISLKNYRSLLNKFCATLKLKKEEIVDHLVEAFKDQIQDYFDTRLLQLLAISKAEEIDGDLQMLSVEMLLLDLLEILMNTYSFVDNTSYLDRPAPLLIGKNLRNYLAHGNPLVDVFPFDPRRAMATHGVLFLEKYFSFEEGVDYGQNVNFDPEHFAEMYHRRLTIVENQARMFEAAARGDVKNVEECVRNGADPSAFDVNGESGLKCAARANNVELLIYFLNQNADEAVEALLESAAENGCESVIEYLMESNPKAAEYMRKDGGNILLHLAVLNNKKSMVTYLLNLGCKVDVKVSGLSPLHVAAENGFDVIVESLLDHGAWVSIRNDDGEQPLHLAARSGSWECAEKLIKKGAAVDQVNCYGVTPLHLAAQFGRSDFVDKMLSQGAKKDLKTEKGYTPVFLAAINGHAETVKVLLKHNANVGITTSDGLTPLHAAATYGHKAVVTQLLKSDVVLLFDTDAHSWSPLHFAAFCGHADLIRPLFARELRTETSATALHLAAYRGDRKTVQELLECDGSVVDEVDDVGCTALYMAAFRGNVDAVRALIRAGANAEIRNEKRSTAFLTAAATGHAAVIDTFLLHCKIPQLELNYALFTAVEFNHERIVQALLKCGADCNFQVQTESKPLVAAASILRLQQMRGAKFLPVDTRSCLIRAAQNGNANIVEMLLKNGGDVNSELRGDFKIGVEEISYEFGHCFKLPESTPSLPVTILPCLHVAAQQGHAEVVEALLEHGAEVDLKDSSGFTALHYAATHDHKNTVKVLLKAGADVSTKNEKGMTALGLAAFRGFVRTAKLLIRHGADVHARNSSSECNALEMAALGEQKDTLELLLQCDFSFEERYMALQTSIIHGKAISVRVFLENTEDVMPYRAALFDLFPPLHNAAYFGKRDVAEVLLGNGGFEVNGRFSEEELTPLHLAIKEQHVSVVQVLLKNGADANAVTSEKQTPLILAIQKCNVDIVQLLLEHGADPVKENNHHSPLHSAVTSNSSQILSVIVESLVTSFDDIRPHVNAKDSDGDSPLMWAIEAKLTEAASILIDLGADVNLKNNLGMSSLHWAVQVKSLELVLLMVDSGADITLKNSEEKTATDIALENLESEDEEMKTIGAFLLSLA